MNDETQNLDETTAKQNEAGVSEEQKNEQTQTLAEILKDEKLSAEHNALVQEAVNNALKLEKEKQEEADKLAKMSDAEKEELKKNELEAKEKALMERELKLDALSLLSDKKLPAELSSIIDYSDADKMKASIDTIEKVFNEAVSNAVESKLTGGAVLKKAPESGETKTVDREKIKNAINGIF